MAKFRCRQCASGLCLLVFVLTSGAVTSVLARQVPRDLPTPNRWWFLEPLFPLFGTSPSSSMEPVALELTTSMVKFHIPRAYVSTVGESNQVSQSFINLVVYLPDYLPRSLADKAGHRTRGEMINGIQLRSKDEIGIHLAATLPGTDKKHIERLKSYTIYGGKADDRFDIYYRKDYRAKADEPAPDKRSGFFVPVGRDDIGIAFSILPNGEMVGCTLRYNFNDDLAVEILFSGKHLDRYEQIQATVSELLKQFLLK